MSSIAQPRESFVLRALPIVVPVVILVAIFARSMSLGFDHDEHQFVASGTLLVRQGMLPYRDYPYFHTPYLVFADALLFAWIPYLLLAARGLSALCGAATIGLIYFHARGVAERVGAPPVTREVAALAAGLLLMTNPLFLAADGLAWNHDPSEMLLVAAALLVLNEKYAARFAWRLLLCGLLLGIAIGIRLTTATAAVAFVGFLLADAPPRRTWRTTAVFAAGICVGLLPLAWTYSLAPGPFLFGNFHYPALNTAWREIGPHRLDTSPWGKLLVFAGVCFAKPGNLALLLAAGLSLAMTHRGARPFRRELGFLQVLMLFLLVGSFAPSPSFAVYFYQPLPFAVLWLLYLNAPLLVMPAIERLRAVSVACLVATGVALGLGTYFHAAGAFRTSAWIPVRAHDFGRKLASHVPRGGRVLTLAPIFPLEGRLTIYETYATGPFAMRVGDMITEREELSLRLTDEEDLSGFLRSDPPAAMLVGFEGDVEGPIIRSAGTLPDCRVYALPVRWQARGTPCRLVPLKLAPDPSAGVARQ
jgi:hypothetical protein